MTGKINTADTRILIVAPTGRDSSLVASVLRDAALFPVRCANLKAMAEEIPAGAGALLVTEEALDWDGLEYLLQALDRQPAWSDTPIVLLLSSASGETATDPGPLQTLRERGNVTLHERPIRVATLISTLQAALRGRSRQYEVRDLLTELESGVRQRDEFLAMLAHELRNPLAAISVANHLLIQMMPVTEQTAPVYGIMERQTKQLVRLIDDLLDVSRITTGKILLQKQPLDVIELVNRSLFAVQTAIKERRHTVETAMPSKPLMVEGDPVRLEQIVTNLLTNATKYTPPGGRIRITVENVQNSAVISVSDNGLGIAPETLPHIFDLFQQSERALDRAQGGLGIGLTVVRRLVEMHGGTVTARSDGNGRGSEFVVTLPLGQANLQQHNDVAAGPLPVQSLHILLVEDNADVRALLKMMLARKGHTVDVAEDGQTGLAQALAAPPQVAFIDIGLPGLDGYEVAQMLRAKSTRQPYLIALTGYGQPNDRTRALDAGFNLHLTKPLDIDQLDEILGHVYNDLMALS